MKAKEDFKKHITRRKQTMISRLLVAGAIMGLVLGNVKIPLFIGTSIENKDIPEL